MNTIKKNWNIILIAPILIIVTFFSCYYFDYIAKWMYPNFDDCRGKLVELYLQVLAGLAIAFGLWISHRRAKATEMAVIKQGEALEKQAEQIELTRKAQEHNSKSQIEERFKNAVEHLGNENQAIILGGIAELHQIASEVPTSYAKVVRDIFTAYIRSSYSLNVELKNFNTAQQILDYIFQNEIYQDEVTTVDLQNCNLSGVKLGHAKLLNVNLCGSYLPSVNKVTFDTCDLSESIIEQDELHLSSFINCDMSEISTSYEETIFEEVNFDKCTIMFADFRGAVFNKCHFSETDIQESNLFNITLDGCSFTQCVLNECSIAFSNINMSLRSSSFTQSDFRFSSVESLEISENSEFSLCYLNGINLVELPNPTITDENTYFEFFFTQFPLNEPSNLDAIKVDQTSDFLSNNSKGISQKGIDTILKKIKATL